MSFLTAEWRKLAIANYVIEPEVLSPYLPYGTELDLWKNKCYASLVGFMFLNTRLLGLPIPFHVNFEEVNLRFYVKRWEDDNWKRGVVFIKEIVPRPALSFVANTIYNEHYETWKMKHSWEEREEERRVEYQWGKNGRWNSFQLTAAMQASPIEAGSETEFITEHYWGYAKVNDKLTNEYEVTHPRWLQYKVQEFQINVDFGEVYGKEFEFINQLEPASVMLAEGSEITVESRRRIRH
jgi:uncharacterized protein YqjF (DUF2071 family)